MAAMGVELAAPRSDGASAYLDGPTAAALLGIHQSGIGRLVAAGRLQGRKFGSRWRIVRASVERLLPPPVVEAAEGPEPAPPAVERALALLPELGRGELLAVIQAAAGRLAGEGA